ncbi:hypothetical protein N7462_008374 [Penicillium macrosclerotiorum]|uniref:uncharacterized protein n=1 Tax=Penicillium macrosclerotiorum TaxID=303699 RepID=UPI002548603E|nr:uncharacterized protein N7462_008374 [Penicillium macrosclerotiorum]KAJ5675477.1 hypothetical protein N7462_008374 [Penicillium macrosclerotiorum]
MVESTLGPHPARPPTPPRPGSRIDQDNPESTADVQTPRDSAYATSITKVSPSSHSAKRVNFSPWLHTIIEAPQSTTKARLANSKEISHPQSPYLSDGRPFKSILKETSSPIPVWSPNVDTFTTESLAMLLASVIQQLAGESITSRLDAYMQFFGALRTYEGLPGGKDIADKLGLITESIQRDVSRDLVNGQPLDTNLANQALKLSAAFVWHEDISSHLSDEFRVFLVEQAITCLQEAKMPKSVLTHYMSILSTQNFGSKIMTQTRVTRILTSLQDITKQVSGKAIAQHRLSIYQRLLTQSKSTFLSQPSTWMEHLVFGLLHHMKEIRTKAIALGFQLSMAAGPNAALSRTVRDLFNRPLENGGKLITEIRERMCRMVASAETGVFVPQIWSIIILLLRSKKWNLDQWEHFKEWLLVMQKCFNCSEPSTKSQAIIGWNRFVFAINPSETTGRLLLKMLGKPIISQFERKKSDKPGMAPTPLALTSYYNLLYYTFRPSIPHHHLDFIWEEYVAAPSAAIFSTAPGLSDSAAAVLANMLWCPQAKVWTEQRITNLAKMEVEELPSLDSRWVRSRISSVLNVFESLLKSSVWIDEGIEKSNIALAWNSLSSALSLASSKEITPSGESMQAVASVLGLLHRLWTTGPPSLNAYGEHCEDIFFERFRYLSTTMILSLGGISFTEKLLLRTADETFQASHTSTTHRNPTAGNNLDSPILHLLRIITNVKLITEPTPSYVKLVERTIHASCNGRVTRGSRLELLQQCANLGFPGTASPSLSNDLSVVVWKSSAVAATNALQSYPIDSARERDGSVSRDYENATKILVSGMHFPGAFKEWSDLLESSVRVVRTEKDDEVLVTLVLEPIAEGLAFVPIHDAYLLVASLLRHASSIHFLQEPGRGLENAISPQMRLPPFPHKLLASVGRLLDLTYSGFEAPGSAALAGFIESLPSFLGSGTALFRSQVLEALQSQLVLWMRDKENKFGVTIPVDSRISTACHALSSAILKNIEVVVVDNESSVRQFEGIICAGLESEHIPRMKQFLHFFQSDYVFSDAFDSATTLGKTFSRTMSRLGSQSQNNIEDAITSHSTVHTQSSHKKPADATEKRAVAINSPLPGDGMEASENSEVAEPSLPTNCDAAVPEAPITFQKSRREVFRMIESIRSSSPANTPGKLGFDTPVHLRRLHAAHSGIPLTPTLVPTENEEGFIGSSPTPATRDPTPAMNSDASALKSQDVTMNDAADIPSSPPEMHTRSPSPKKQSRRERRRSAKARRESSRRAVEGQPPTDSTINSLHMGEDMPSISKDSMSGETNENTNTASQAHERPSSRRLRSGLGQTSEHDAGYAPTPSASTPSQPTESFSASRNTRSKSGSKKKNRKSTSKPENDAGEQAAKPFDAPSTSVTLECDLDSSTEELETQIASQLEQDLELAVDMGVKTDENPSTHKKADRSKSKKRKREEDHTQTSVKERRRSTRLSTTQDVMVVDLEELDATQPHAFPTSEPPQQAVVRPTSTTPRRSTRNSQRRGSDATVFEVSPLATRISEPIQEEPARKEEDSRQPSKQSLQSLCLDEPLTPDIIEKSLSRPRSSRGHRSRKRRSGHTGAQSDEERQPETELQIHDNDLLDKQNDLTDAEAGGISHSLKKLLGDMKSAKLGPDALREVDDLLFDIRVEAHNASRRHSNIA